MAHKALDVAKFIIVRTIGDLITNLKLQKLLYYVQAWYMCKNNGELLFDDDIEAWKHGPVVRDVYDIYKKFSHKAIDVSNNECDQVICKFDDKDKEFIDNFLEEFMDYSTYSLCRMSHEEDPWIDAFAKKTEPKIISTDSMYQFYAVQRGLKKEEFLAAMNTPIEECHDDVEW